MNKTNTILDEAKTIFFVGIKGVGMTALAQILKAKGKNVRGSDTKESFFTEDTLHAEQIKFFEGFSKEHISNHIDLLVRSDAYTEKHEEVAEALKRHIPVLRYQEVLNVLSQKYPTIAITGSHGKTTTTALAGVLHECIGEDPTVLVGSEVPAFHGLARTGKGNLFITEADEYNRKLLTLHPSTLVITNIDYDHPDTYSTTQEYQDVFNEAIQKLSPKAQLIINIDDEQTNALNLESFQGEIRTIGILHNDAEMRAEKRKCHNNGTQTFEVIWKNASIGTFSTTLLGEHNVYNILAGLATLPETQLQGENKNIQKAIQTFRGTKRRLEIVGETVKGAIVYDDYAHHPTEIQKTLRAVKERYPEKRIYCIFHPHTYSRTEALLEEFAKSFHDASHTYVLDIYSSAREVKGNVSSEDLVKRINDEGVEATYVPNTEKVIERLREKATSHDIIITMGAGDVWQIAHKLIAQHINDE